MNCVASILMACTSFIHKLLSTESSFDGGSLQAFISTIINTGWYLQNDCKAKMWSLCRSSISPVSNLGMVSSLLVWFTSLILEKEIPFANNSEPNLGDSFGSYNCIRRSKSWSEAPHDALIGITWPNRRGISNSCSPLICHLSDLNFHFVLSNLNIPKAKP